MFPTEGADFNKYSPKKLEKKQPCFVQLSHLKSAKDEQRCFDLEPNIQHDRNPKVRCNKFRRKLQQFKEFIKQSATPKESSNSSEHAPSNQAHHTQDNKSQDDTNQSRLKNTVSRDRSQQIEKIPSALPSQIDELKFNKN